jgi:hypothetical protein
VRYDGVPVQLPYGPGVIPTDDGALVLGEPEGASSWFPVNDHPLDKAAYTVSVTVPEGLEAIGNGALESVRTKAGRSTWTWNAREPMAPYLASTSIGEFDVDAYRNAGLRYWDAIDPDLFVDTTPAPTSGTRYAYSQRTGDGPSYKRLARTITVPDGGAELAFRVAGTTEESWDFFLVEAHRPGSDEWTTLPDENGHTTRDTGFSCPWWLELHPFLAHYQSPAGDETCDPSGSTGEWWAASGSSDGWLDWRMDLSDYAGGQVEVALTYVSDEVVQEQGVFVDDVVVSTGEGTTSFEDDGDTLDGWHVPGPPPGSAPNENDWTVTEKVIGEPLGVQVQASLDQQPEMIRFMESLFGPYPFSTAGGVVDDHDAGFALEIQTRPVYSPAFWTFGAGDDVVVHELAHQWYGDHVALARWRDIWLNEGFASYAEWLWAEHAGNATTQEIFDFFYHVAFPPEDPFWELAIGDPGPERLFDGAVYLRGAMTLHALRGAIGDGDFFRLLREWSAGDGNRTTDEFVAMAERVSGRELDALFDAWLFTTSRPGLAEAGRMAGRSAAPAAPGRMPAAVKSVLNRMASGERLP